MHWLDSVFEVQAFLAIVLCIGYAAMLFFHIAPDENYKTFTAMALTFFFVNQASKNGGSPNAV